MLEGRLCSAFPHHPRRRTAGAARVFGDAGSDAPQQGRNAQRGASLQTGPRLLSPPLGRMPAASADMSDPIPLLDDSDPPPFRVAEGSSASPYVIAADHAGRVIPRGLGTLGLTAADLDTHIAWD